MTTCARLAVGCLALLLTLAACSPHEDDDTANSLPTGSEASVAAQDALPAPASDHETDATRPAPWDDGWPRKWFYPHPRDEDDSRWARIAKLVGQRAPPLEALSDWSNAQATTLDDLRGQVVLLKFWATWCGDCKASVPITGATAKRLGDRVATIEVCASKGGEKHAEAVRRWGIELPTALDATGASEAAYDVPRWPYYVLIDSEGVVRATGLRTAHVDAAIDHLLTLEPKRN